MNFKRLHSTVIAAKQTSVNRLACRTRLTCAANSAQLAITFPLLICLLFITNDAESDWLSPLEEREKTAAINIVNAISIEQSALQRSKSITPHPLGVQILLVERQEQKNQSSNKPRLAEVFSFNYDQQISTRHLVNVDSETLVSSTTIQSPHLPLSNDEINYSEALTWADAETSEKVREELIRLNKYNTSAVQSRVAIWVPNTPKHAGVSGCDTQRCALLSLFTDNERSLSIEPVVNLITGHVYANLFP